MIQIAIVEDDKNQIETMKKYIDRYEKESGYHFHVHVFEDGEDIVENYAGIYDIILMDIEMQFMNGMEAAKEIRKVDSEVVIIFITNMSQYAMKGYEVEALDFVLKPINYFAFSQRIDRALTRMERRQRKHISFFYKGKMKKILLSDILYIEVQNHNLYYHAKDGIFSQRGTMKEVENALEGEPFFRCNNCYLINLEYVNGFEENCVVVGEDSLQVSRARKKELLDVLNDYLNGVSK